MDVLNILPKYSQVAQTDKKQLAFAQLTSN
jgi:hypothetical protein